MAFSKFRFAVLADAYNALPLQGAAGVVFNLKLNDCAGAPLLSGNRTIAALYTDSVLLAAEIANQITLSATAGIAQASSQGNVVTITFDNTDNCGARYVPCFTTSYFSFQYPYGETVDCFDSGTLITIKDRGTQGCCGDLTDYQAIKLRVGDWYQVATEKIYQQAWLLKTTGKDKQADAGYTATSKLFQLIALLLQYKRMQLCDSTFDWTTKINDTDTACWIDTFRCFDVDIKCLFNIMEIPGFLDCCTPVTQSVICPCEDIVPDALPTAYWTFDKNDGDIDQGTPIDCSGTPDYPIASANTLLRVTIAGKIGGVAGVDVFPGDSIICILNDTTGGTQAVVGAKWKIEPRSARVVPFDCCDGSAQMVTTTIDQDPTTPSITVGPTAPTLSVTKVLDALVSFVSNIVPRGSKKTGTTTMNLTACGKTFTKKLVITVQDTGVDTVPVSFPSVSTAVDLYDETTHLYPGDVLVTLTEDLAATSPAVSCRYEETPFYQVTGVTDYNTKGVVTLLSPDLNTNVFSTNVILQLQVNAGAVVAGRHYEMDVKFTLCGTKKYVRKLVFNVVDTCFGAHQAPNAEDISAPDDSYATTKTTQTDITIEANFPVVLGDIIPFRMTQVYTIGNSLRCCKPDSPDSLTFMSVRQSGFVDNPATSGVVFTNVGQEFTRSLGWPYELRATFTGYIVKAIAKPVSGADSEVVFILQRAACENNALSEEQLTIVFHNPQ